MYISNYFEFIEMRVLDFKNFENLIIIYDFLFHEIENTFQFLGTMALARVFVNTFTIVYISSA